MEKSVCSCGFTGQHKRVVPGSRSVTGWETRHGNENCPMWTSNIHFECGEQSRTGALYALRQTGTDCPNPSYILVRTLDVLGIRQILCYRRKRQHRCKNRAITIILFFRRKVNMSDAFIRYPFQRFITRERTDLCGFCQRRYRSEGDYLRYRIGSETEANRSFPEPRCRRTGRRRRNIYIRTIMRGIPQAQDAFFFWKIIDFSIDYRTIGRYNYVQ